MTKIAVLIVDDSAFMRKALTRIIEHDGLFEVVAVADNGKMGLELIDQFRPQVVTLDVEMPVMNGLEMLKELRARQNNVPVVVVSSITKFGSDIAIQCLANGAFDIVRKPESYVSMDIHKISTDLLTKLKQAATPRRVRSKPVSQPATHPAQPSEPSRPEKGNVWTSALTTRRAVFGQKVVTIGSSTGGTIALQHVLSNLPATFAASLVIVQHMPPGSFINSLAERLNSFSPLTVRLAENNEPLQQGVAYIAPIGIHTTLARLSGQYRIHFTKKPTDLLHCPAVDVLFESAGQVFRSNNVSCILTGMGADGAQGLKSVKSGGGYVIAESEETCAVYGMPRSAVEAGVVDISLPIHDIATALTRLF